MSHREDFEPRETTDELAELFAAYRQSIPDPEASADFMPRLWERIEARQSFASGFKHFSQRIMTVAALASLVMGAFLAVPRHSTSPYYTHTYLELLAAGQGQENAGEAAIVEAVHEGAR
jgi:hypothetical protein